MRFDCQDWDFDCQDWDLIVRNEKHPDELTLRLVKSSSGGLGLYLPQHLTMGRRRREKEKWEIKKGERERGRRESCKWQDTNGWKKWWLTNYNNIQNSSNNSSRLQWIQWWWVLCTNQRLAWSKHLHFPLVERNNVQLWRQCPVEETMSGCGDNVQLWNSNIRGWEDGEN